MVVSSACPQLGAQDLGGVGRLPVREDVLLVGRRCRGVSERALCLGWGPPRGWGAGAAPRGACGHI